MLTNIRIILINTYHPGNIGSAARAMKTMGLSDLSLVTPQRFPASDADSMAAGAQDVLANARVFESLDDAIADCSMVIGTSARGRSHTFTRPMLTAENATDQLVREAVKNPVALVFGQETMGLTNQELEKCHYHVSIDANPEYPVLNVASAIQILCYEIRKSSLHIDDQCESDEEASEYPLTRELEYFYEHLEETLNDINFIIKTHPGLAMNRMRKLFNKARPDIKELNMLRGILAAAQRKNKDDF